MMNYFNIDLEQLILSALLYRNSIMLSIDILPEDFFFPDHADIFREMQRLVSENGSFRLNDFVFWSRGKKMADMPVYDYISLLCEATPDELATKSNCAILKEFSRKRKIYEAIKASEAILESRQSAEVQSFLIGKMKQAVETESIKTCDQIRQEIIGSLELPQERNLTGLGCLDRPMSGGLYAGFTYGFCGAEKAGKTTLAHTVSFNLKCNHLYIAMEMGAKQIEQRNLAREMSVNSLRFLEDPASLKNRTETVRPNKFIHYLDLPGGTLDEIIFHAGTAILKYGIKGFIVDYWQLVEGKLPQESEERHLRNVAQGLANFARKQNVWCILLAQMNKEGGLFGGNGIRKACDQLYMIEFCQSQFGTGARWLRMDASRYTMRGDIGSENDPCMMLDPGSGPHFQDTKF